MGKRKGGRHRVNRQNPNKSKKRQKKKRGKNHFSEEEKSRYRKDLEQFRVRLAEIGLSVREIAGDGNCLFRAIAD